MAIVGFVSGAPYALVNDPISAWLTRMDVSLSDIGFSSLVFLGYPLKVLWAPFLDRTAPPGLRHFGRRLGWIVAMIPLFVAAIVLMAWLGAGSPRQAILAVWVFGSMAVLASATVDIAADAYRTDIAIPERRASAAATFVAGYRVAYVLLPAAALWMSKEIGWPWTFTILAGVVLAPVGGLLRAPRPDEPVSSPTLRESIVEPWRSMHRLHGGWWAALLALVLVFRLPDLMAAKMAMPFLLKTIGFLERDVALYRQVLGLVMTLVGAFAGAAAAPRMGLTRSLVAFGALQAASNLGYVALMWSGPSKPALITVMSIENFCGGLVAAGFVAFLMSCCERAHSGTQYALLSALMALGAAVGPFFSGALAESMGFGAFFLLTIGLGVVGVILVLAMRKHLNALEVVSTEPLEAL